jgi:serine/threonine protein phosphatase PrpC
MIKAELFSNPFVYASGVDIGAKRRSNEDAIVSCPEYGFFAVSDGMGGLLGGAKTAEMVEKTLPVFIGEAYKELKKKPTPEFAEELLKEQVRLISDNVFETLNLRSHKMSFGATLTAVWLVGNHAVFLNLGDSRGYRLNFYKKQIKQVTTDHNIAAELAAVGEITREEARTHKSNNALTRFIGMESPALPETFIEEIKYGDRILLCSDGLNGMVEDARLSRLLRSSKIPERVIKLLIDEANAEGGLDNISAVYIKILR